MNLQNNKLNIIVNCYNNLNCDKCYIDTQIPVIKPNFSKRKLHNIFSYFKNQGVRKVSFIGGEPLMSSFLLMEYIDVANKYFEFISLTTNGILLDEYTLDRMMEKGLQRVKFSLLSTDENKYKEMAGLIQHIELPKEIIKKSASRKNLDVILYVPIYSENVNSEFSSFDNLLAELNLNKITFLTTEPHQFDNLQFFQNISKTAHLTYKDSYLEIYDTKKYNIGFFDIMSYLRSEDNYYLFPDLQVRTSISLEDRIFEIA